MLSAEFPLRTEPIDFAVEGSLLASFVNFDCRIRVGWTRSRDVVAHLNSSVAESRARSQAGKAFFQQLNLTEIPLQAVSPTKLAGRYPETARDEALSSLRTAQVNDGSELLFLRQARLRRARRGQSTDHPLVKIRGGQFGRMARQRSRVEIIKPTGTEIVPRAIAHDLMIPDAILARHSERPVGDLKHAERAGGRTIDFQRIP